jgi:hypothetical protein
MSDIEELTTRCSRWRAPTDRGMAGYTCESNREDGCAFYRAHNLTWILPVLTDRQLDRLPGRREDRR